MIDIAQSTTLLNENVIKYHMMRQLEHFLIKNGFCIYGGYVRDIMIHDHYAMKFYKKAGEHTDMYSNENFLPEYKGRLVIPKDIDCFFNKTTEEARECIFKLKKKGFDVDFTFTADRSYTKFEGVEYISATIRLCNYVMLGLKHIFVKIDICHGTNVGLKPPFGKLDMLCNAFLLTKNGIQLSDNTGTYLDDLDTIGRKLSELKIVKNMLSFKTKITETMFSPMFQDVKVRNALQFSENLKFEMSQILTADGFYRVSKMVNRGWELFMLMEQVESVVSWKVIEVPSECPELEENSESCDIEDYHITVFGTFPK